MNFGIHQPNTTTTIYTNTNTTSTATDINTFEVLKGEIVTAIKYCSSSTEEQSSSNSCSSSNHKERNNLYTEELSGSFLTTQNCLGELTSLQNKTVSDSAGSNCPSFATSAITLPSSSSLLSLTTTSSNAAYLIDSDDLYSM